MGARRDVLTRCRRRSLRSVAEKAGDWSVEGASAREGPPSPLAHVPPKPHHPRGKAEQSIVPFHHSLKARGVEPPLVPRNQFARCIWPAVTHRRRRGLNCRQSGAHHEEPEQVLPQAQSIPILRSGASRPAQGQRLAVNRRNTGERGGRTGWPHLLTKSGHLIRVHQQGLRSEAATAAFISTRILKENTNRDGC